MLVLGIKYTVAGPPIISLISVIIAKANTTKLISPRISAPKNLDVITTKIKFMIEIKNLVEKVVRMFLNILQV